MATKRDLERLENENRSLNERLSDTELELARKDEGMKKANQR